MILHTSICVEFYISSAGLPPMLLVPISDKFRCGKLNSGRGIMPKLINVTIFSIQVFTNISREEQEDGNVFRQDTIENLSHFCNSGGEDGLIQPEEKTCQKEICRKVRHLTFLIKVKVSYESESKLK